MIALKQLVFAGVIGLVVGIMAYVFIAVQRYSENREIERWNRDNANLSPSELEELRQKKYSNRIFPGVSNKYIYALIFLVVLIFIVAELGLLR